MNRWRKAATMFALVGAAELLVMDRLEPAMALRFRDAAGGLVAGLLVAAFAAIAYFVLTRWKTVGSANAPAEAVRGAVIVAVVSLCFESVLHVLLTGLNDFSDNWRAPVVNALALASIAGLLTAWLSYTDDEVRERSAVEAPRIRSLGTPLICGLLLTALCLTAVPEIAAINNANRWHMADGSAQILNLAGRQRMWCQRIGRLALLDGEKSHDMLRQAVESADAEARQLQHLVGVFETRRGHAENTSVGLGAQSDEYRRRYLLLAREISAGRADAASVSELQVLVDVFLAVIETEITGFQQQEEAFIAGMQRSQMIRLVVGPVMIFMLAIAMLALSVVRVFETGERLS